MWYLLIAHQQESFLPFPSRQSLSCCLSHVAKGSTPKPRGPNFCPSHVIPTYSTKASWSSLVWLPHRGLNPQANPPLQPHFRLFLQSVTPTSIPVFFQLYWAAIVSLDRQWPHGMEPIISKLSHRHCNQGELPPSYILGGSDSHPPGSKHGHSYLTYLWNQLKIIDMLNDHARGSLHSCCYTKQLWMALLPVSHPPSSDLWGWGHRVYIFLIFPGYLEFCTPLLIPIWGPPWLHPVTSIKFQKST